MARRYQPKDAIIAAFEIAGKSGADEGAPGDCLLVNTVLEVSPHDPEVRDLVDGCLREVERFFYAMIVAAKREGTISQSIRPRRTAQALLGLFLGLRVLTRSAPHARTVGAVLTQARSILE